MAAYRAMERDERSQPLRPDLLSVASLLVEIFNRNTLRTTRRKALSNTWRVSDSVIERIGGFSSWYGLRNYRTCVGKKIESRMGMNSPTEVFGDICSFSRDEKTGPPRDDRLGRRSRSSESHGDEKMPKQSFGFSTRSVLCR